MKIEWPERIYSVSFPRSGHHLLARLLRAYFRSSMKYCGYYGSDGCCGQVPCANPATTYSKNHDGRLRLSQSLGRYVIQYRSPIPTLISDYELALKIGPAKPRSREEFYDHLSRRADHWRRWMHRWVFSFSSPLAVKLPYETLTGEPHTALSDVIGLACAQAQPKSVGAAITAVGIKMPRDVREFRYWDEERMREAELLLRPEIDRAALPYVTKEIAKL